LTAGAGSATDLVDDAMHATRAAVEEGILPGGGVALLRAVEALKRAKAANDDQKHGIGIVKKAITWPARQITINSGEDGSVVVGRILENDTYDYGFDAQTSELGDLERLCRSSKTGPRLRAS
jgi:chaperonin GroEL